jgi:hypothetical protein
MVAGNVVGDETPVTESCTVETPLPLAAIAVNPAPTVTEHSQPRLGFPYKLSFQEEKHRFETRWSLLTLKLELKPRNLNGSLFLSRLP